VTDWLLLFMFHYLGDFVFQSDWMASNKARNPLALGLHTAVYTVVLGVWAYGADPTGMEHPFYWVVMNGGLHGLTDAVTSQGTRYFAQDESPDWHNFFVVVGGDQCIHYCTMVGTWFWLANAA
jgi:hypothetical protein